MAITAAHCVHLPYVSGVRKMTIEKGEYLYNTRKDGTISRIGYVPKFSKVVNIEIELASSLKDKFDQNGYKAKISPSVDMAIIWWKENTDVFYEKNFPTIVSPNELNKIIKSISNFNPSITTINYLSDSSTLDYKRSANLNSLKWTYTNYLESKSLSRVDEGDSGSPIFVEINGMKKIIAVVKGKASTLFDNWDAFTSVTKITCEIDKHLPSDLRIKECN